VAARACDNFCQRSTSSIGSTKYFGMSTRSGLCVELAVASMWQFAGRSGLLEPHGGRARVDVSEHAGFLPGWVFPVNLLGPYDQRPLPCAAR
jgi:hypothetical protein